MSRARCWFITLSVLALSNATCGQSVHSWSGARDTRVFRPRLFSDRPLFAFPATYPSMSDQIGCYGPTFSATRYYDSILRSPYGLDSSRSLYQGMPPTSTWQDP